MKPMRSLSSKPLAPPGLTAAVAALCAALCLAAPALAAPDQSAGKGLWSVGMQSRGFVDFEPGNDYMTGFDAGYSPARWFRQRLELRAAYLTSRPEAAYRNVLRQDWFLFSPVWHFRRQKLFDPTVQLDLGWQRYDVENEAIFGDLENSTSIKGLQVGLQFNIKSRYAVRYAFGYQSASTASSVVYPLPFTLGIAMAFP
jgi:hypothetical protein